MRRTLRHENVDSDFCGSVTVESRVTVDRNVEPANTSALRYGAVTTTATYALNKRASSIKAYMGVTGWSYC